MIREIKVQGKQKFMGINIPVIVGGFGDKTKCVLAKDIATIHKMELKEVNQSVKRLIEKNRIKENTHYIDLKESVTHSDLQLDKEFVRKSANIFLLSERGYASLIKYMDDDTSWEVHDRFVDEYFELKEIVEQVSENYSLRLDNLNRLFRRVYPQEYESVANEILDFHVALGKKQRLDKRHKKYDDTEYKQFVRDKMVESLEDIQTDITNKDILTIQLYAKDLVIKLQNDYRFTNNRSDGKTISNLKKTYSKDMLQMGLNAVELVNHFSKQQSR